MRFPLKVLFLSGVTIFTLHAGRGSTTMHAINEQPGYMRPLATSIGTMTNSGWFQSASIDKEFGFGVALPISLIYIGSKDRTYTDSYTDFTGTVNVAVPTIFGSEEKPLIPGTTFRAGLEEFRELSVIPYITVQTSFSFYYTELKLRYMGMPTIKKNGFHFPGIGIQHDFHYLFPSLPVAIALAGNMTFLNTSLTPGDKLDGTLKTGGIAGFLGIVAGYRPIDNLEIFLETGWDHSHVSVKGDIVSTEDNGWELIPVNNRIAGRNAFRAALNIAVPIKYHPVAGVIAGAQWGNLINLISYKSRH
ncbi:MAG: hypothetical protein JW863_22805 [Chitinispirillaceae bacterium]|nr:hypothetical protein [Chitinispirillaceae bacterium]